ncbi:MAG: LruC domain-containing protein [Bacteroidia bacterium]
MKTIYLLKTLIICVVFFSFFSCKRQITEKLPNDKNNNPIDTSPVNSVNQIRPPANFNFNTVETKQITVTILGTDDKPVVNAVVVFSDNSINANGNILAKGITDYKGEFKTEIDIPTFYKFIVCNTCYKGVPQNLLLPNTSSKILNFTIGSSKPNTFQTIDESAPFNIGSGKKNVNKFSGRLGTWNSSSGLPDYLRTPNDVISSQLMSDINSVLPERVAVPGRRDDLLNDNLTRRLINLVETCEVFVTFVFEGAGYKNTLFYYTYPTNNPPATVNDIDSFYVVFPNASFNNSGGQMVSGQKVKLGNFGAGTTIAYGIAADGWKGGTNGFRGVTTGFWLLYANKDFNPEPNTNLKQHMVLLNDRANNRLVMGFEDIKRDLSGCDHDFNDVIFYTTANPVTAIDVTGIAVLPSGTDTDGDGVPDNEDEFPNDNARAFRNYYPNGGTYATVAFEDLWPYKGDYDLNDVVVDFKYEVVTDALNMVKDVEGFYTLRASGGFIQNSFAVEFPTLRSNITNLTGGTLENGAKNAVVKIFDNTRAEMSGWNTFPGVAYVDTVTYRIKFTLNNPIASNVFGIGQYNPFIWGNNDGRNRGFEIHLPGKNFTNLANTSIFGTADDNTQINGSNTYKTKDNLFWAISIPERFDYPKEQKDITTAYLRFAQWARSNGTQFTDWYKNNSGNRNSENIYQKP